MPADDEETVGEVEGSPFGELPRPSPHRDFRQVACLSVGSHLLWATLFRRDCLWQAALLSASNTALRDVTWRVQILELLFCKIYHVQTHPTDQFIACRNSRDMAHELASQIWIAVIDNLEENEHTFLLLKRLAQEPDVFLPYPYSRSVNVQWRVFEKLFTDFRDCLNSTDYYDVMARARASFSRFHLLGRVIRAF